MLSKSMLRAVFVVMLVQQLSSLENGVARTPPMGWMSWGYYACGVQCDTLPHKCLDEALILSVADEFYNNGYIEAGYEYIIIDDCWSEKARDGEGNLVADRKRFPRGMKFLADYIHSKGLKFGMYTNVADVTCMHYPGSRRHLKRDAELFASWAVDYIKVDGCFVGEDWLNTVYMEFGSHLNKTGRPIVYSCSWPYYIEFIHHKMPDYKQISAHCNLWRNYHDISLHWLSVRSIVSHYQAEHARMSGHAGPGHWNDPDMIIVGTGSLTPGQARVQLAVWAVLSAPLLLSCDVTRVAAWERSLLLNMELIAVDQDVLGLQATPHQSVDGLVTIWLKKHTPMKANIFHSYTFALVNLERADSDVVEITPRQYGLDNPDGYTVRDMFLGEFIRNVSLDETLQATVPGEDVVMYTLYPLTQR